MTLLSEGTAFHKQLSGDLKPGVPLLWGRTKQKMHPHCNPGRQKRIKYCDFYQLCVTCVEPGCFRLVCPVILQFMMTSHQMSGHSVSKPPYISTPLDDLGEEISKVPMLKRELVHQSSAND